MCQGRGNSNGYGGRSGFSSGNHGFSGGYHRGGGSGRSTFMASSVNPNFEDNSCHQIDMDQSESNNGSSHANELNKGAAGILGPDPPGYHH